jgi:phosphoserine phosphatase
MHTGTHVYLISGGFRQMIDPIATTLGIPLERVYANNILFDTHGEYESFDAQEPTSRDGGKAAVIQVRKSYLHIFKVQSYEATVHSSIL